MAAADRRFSPARQMRPAMSSPFCRHSLASCRSLSLMRSRSSACATLESAGLKTSCLVFMSISKGWSICPSGERRLPMSSGSSFKAFCVHGGSFVIGYEADSGRAAAGREFPERQRAHWPEVVAGRPIHGRERRRWQAAHEIFRAGTSTFPLRFRRAGRSIARLRPHNRKALSRKAPSQRRSPAPQPHVESS